MKSCCWVLLFLLPSVLYAQNKYVLSAHQNDFSEWLDSTEAYQAMLRQLEILYQEGRALAHWQLDSIQKTNALGGRTAYYQLQRGPLVECDSLFLYPKQILRYHVLCSMLQWNKGSVFIKKNIERNLVQMNQNGLITSAQHQYFFDGHSARLRLQIQKKKQNEINAILGAQPNSGGKKTLIGEASLRLYNAFLHAETFEWQWQRQSSIAQRMQLQLDLPYCFHTSFGINVGADLYYKANNISQTQFKVATQYRFSPIQSTLIFFEKKRTSLIGNAENINVQSQLIGLEYAQKWFSENTQTQIKLNFGKGKRLYSSNTTDNSTSLLQFSEEIKFRIQQSSFFSSMHFNHWKMGTSAQLPQEWRRIGGSQTLRGFQQESLFIREGFIGQFNWGMGKISTHQFYLYTDFAQLCDNVKSVFKPYYGAGMGAQFITDAGQIEVNYGWGKFPNQLIQLRNGIFNLSYQVYF